MATVLAAVAAIVAISMMTTSSSTTPTSASAAPTAVLSQLFAVPAGTLDAIGVGTATSSPQPVSEPALTRDGKPQVLYLGAEYCPYCATERWPLIQALSRFGTFTGLRTTTSAADDVHPSTPTFTFHGSTYHSDYLAFTARELYTNQRKGGRYAPLEQPTADDVRMLAAHGNAFPLVDFAGRYVVRGASYDPSLLDGQTWATIAGSLATPDNPIARGVDGAANVLTATLCTLTGQRPTAVCSAPAVTAAAGARR